MTYKKDFNAIILHLLRGLVKDALQFEEIVSGSVANLDHIDVKVDELQSKVIYTRHSLCDFEAGSLSVTSQLCRMNIPFSKILAGT